MGVMADYLLFGLIWWLMGTEIQQYPLVKQAVDLAQIGLAFMAVFGALVHGAFSTWGQIKLDMQLSREGGGKV